MAGRRPTLLILPDRPPASTSSVRTTSVGVEYGSPQRCGLLLSHRDRGLPYSYRNTAAQLGTISNRCGYGGAIDTSQRPD